MKEIIQAGIQHLSRGESFVLATIMTRAGSAPRTAGARMLILADGSIAGTIGGGLLEARAIEMAAQVFADKQGLIQEFMLTGEDAASMEMICGGQIEVMLTYVDAAEATYLAIYREILAVLAAHQRAWLITPVPAITNRQPRPCLFTANGSVIGRSPLAPGELKELSRQAGSRHPALVTFDQTTYLVEPVYHYGQLYLFGAGHVSQKLAPLAATVGFSVVVLDDRPEFANPDRFSMAEKIMVLESFEQALAGLEINPDSYLIIVTRGHLHDKTVLAQALQTEAGYIGMIGSKRKRNTIYEALVREGVSLDSLERVYSPLGLAIGAESPEEIAVSILAELIKVRAGRNR